MRDDLVIDKPKDGKPSSGRRGAPAPGQDHIVANLRQMFQGLEQEDLPDRFKTLLEELAKKEKS